MFYLFAIIGMICWGISPIFAKLGLKDVNPLIGLSIRTMFATLVVFAWLLISGNIVELKAIPVKTVLLLIAEAFIATLVGDLFYFAALKKGSASIVMLIMSCSPLVTILFSILIFNEKITLVKSIGAGLIIIGIYLLV
ncbi:MAG TPA: EamA family transporter [Ruminiclostridium sp.]|nr:EamA family transporter [Ruminiclostridium sp.]